MNWVTILIFLSTESASARVVCYYSSWAASYKNLAKVEPEDLKPNLCSHIIYAFVKAKEDGSLVPYNQNFDISKKGYLRTTRLKESNPKLKVLLGIGSTPGKIFSGIAADANRRMKIVKDARSFIEKYNFDGIDLDWEIPREDDKENFLDLLRGFKSDFQKNKWLITAAVRCVPSLGYDVPQINQILDFINVMTYDFYGPWSKYTGQNSPLYSSSIESAWEKKNLNLAAAIQQWLNSGADAEKINAGLAFYGRTFTLKDPSINGLHAPIVGAGRPGPFRKGKGSLSYLEFCSFPGNWSSCLWDDEQKVSICSQGDQWLGIDTQKSIRLKAEFIKAKNLGGAMIWAVDHDDIRGHCGSVTPLLETVNDNL